MADPPGRGLPRWAVVAGIAAPVSLIGGYLGAAPLQPGSYSSMRDTISQLAAHGANDPWLMTSALTGLGVCYLLLALGLRPARGVGRGLLATGGVATLCIAVLRQPQHGYSLGHELAVIIAALTCCTWPAFAAVDRPQHAPLLARAPSVTAAGFSAGLAVWFALESHGALLGVAERCAASAPPLWLFAVAVTTQRSVARLRTGHAADRADRLRP